MNEINQIVISICAAAVTGSVMYILLPEGNLSKIIKTVTGIFILGCIIMPVLSLKNIDFKTEFSTSAFESNDLNSTFSSQLMNTTKESLENMVRSQLTAKGISVLSIETSMDIDSSNCISIEGMKVNAQCGSLEAEKAEDELKSTYGINITITGSEKTAQ